MIKKVLYTMFQRKLNILLLAFTVALFSTYILHRSSLLTSPASNSFSNAIAGSHVVTKAKLTRSTPDPSTSQMPPGFQEATCKFPNVDPFNPNIVKLAGVGQKKLRCDQDFMQEITFINGRSIRVNASKINATIGLSHCHYRLVTRPEFKDNNIVFSKWSKPFNTSIELSTQDEFVHVECFGKNNTKTVISKAYYSLVPKRDHLNKLYDVKLKKRSVLFKPKETLNLIMVALDGLPRHQMIRGMPKTYNHLVKNLSAFDFTMHSQVEDNTFPNFLAILSGNGVWETRKWWDFKKPEDAFDLMWHDFERAGYRTLYSEDYPKGGGFYWGGRSFLYPQTSYWNRPIEIAMLEDKGFIRRKSTCAGPRPISEYQLEYLTRFLDTFPKSPVACGTFIINLTHDDSTKASLIDEHIFNFLKSIEDKGHMKNSVVMFFSDHGQRWGKIRQTYNGIVESRNPFLLLKFPPWFLERYPELEKNLRTNTRRLTTHFDTHQTLLDLIYFKSEVPTPLYRGTYGISLFKEIPADRTCKDAPVTTSQCLCGQNVEKWLNTSSQESVKLANALVDAVKAKGDKQKCMEYSLDSIKQVGVLSMPTASAKEKKRHQAYSVRLTVKPGGAMFEGTVHLDTKEKQISVGENIERLNMYKGEVECRPTSREQMYCYCKDNVKH